MNFWPYKVADLAGDQPFYIFKVFERFLISGNEFEVVAVVVVDLVVVVVVLVKLQLSKQEMPKWLRSLNAWATPPNRRFCPSTPCVCQPASQLPLILHFCHPVGSSMYLPTYPNENILDHNGLGRGLGWQGLFFGQG